MSIVGILGSNLFSAGAAQTALQTQGAQPNTPKFEQIKNEFQQLGQDLQSGNLAQAQADYTTLSSNFPGASQANTTAAATTASTTAAATTTAATTTGQTTVAQQFAQLGQDLQSGNLQAAQQDYTNIQQTTQQAAQQNGTQQTGGHHHHGHHHHGGTEAASSSQSSSSQQSNPISQAFSALSADLQAGNLSGAQTAFATLQNDLQQIGGFSSSGSNSLSPTSTGSGSTTGGGLSVDA